MSLTAIDGGDGTPLEPEWHLTYSDDADIALAREQWAIIVREMKDAGTLTVANGHAIERLVNFRIVYEHAAREVAEHGAVTKAKRTKVLQYSPHYIVMRQAADSIRPIEGELGVAPYRRRAAEKVDRKKRVARPSDAWLNPTNRGKNKE